MNQFKFDFSMFPRFQGILSSNILIHKSNRCHNLDFWINEDKIHAVSPTIKFIGLKHLSTSIFCNYGRSPSQLDHCIFSGSSIRLSQLNFLDLLVVVGLS